MFLKLSFSKIWSLLEKECHGEKRESCFLEATDLLDKPVLALNSILQRLLSCEWVWKHCGEVSAWEDNVNSRVGLETGLLEDMVTTIAFTWEGGHVAM